MTECLRESICSFTSSLLATNDAEAARTGDDDTGDEEEDEEGEDEEDDEHEAKAVEDRSFGDEFSLSRR